MNSDLAVDLSPTAPAEVNPNGGKQSTVTCALDVVPTALLRIGRVLYDGEAKYEQGPQLVGQENWRLIPARMHARHALTHLVAWLAGDTTDHHLEHCGARILMAVEEELRDEED